MVSSTAPEHSCAIQGAIPWLKAFAPVFKTMLFLFAGRQSSSTTPLRSSHIATPKQELFAASAVRKQWWELTMMTTSAPPMPPTRGHAVSKGALHALQHFWDPNPMEPCLPPPPPMFNFILRKYPKDS